VGIVDLEFEDVDGVPVARASGEIDMSVVAGVEERLQEAVPDGAPGLVFDLSGIDYIDSSGLRLLIVTASGLEERQKRCRLVVVEGSAVDSLLLQTGVQNMIAVDRAVPAAVAALQDA
jgi:anti-sigma B factor antagonist